MTAVSGHSPTASVRDPYLKVIWTDPETSARGYVVIDQLIDGLAAGGLRMRPGCTIDEVADLARAMTLKDAIAFLPNSRHRPVGGGKGGIDFDPLDPKAPHVLERYMQAIRPLLTSCFATGEDLGVRQDDLDTIAHRLGLRSTVDAALARLPDAPNAVLERVARGFAQTDRGLSLGDAVGGYGVARAACAALRGCGRGPAECTAVVQGFGSMGGATARYLSDAGIRVIGIADANGLASNPAGLDVESLLATRDRHGRIHRNTLRPQDQLLPRDAWTPLSCDLFVPAATSYVIHAGIAAHLPASLVVEAANVATSADAEAILARRGIPVVPDFIANMATNAWWWWLLSGDIAPTVPAAFAQIDAVMDPLVAEALERSPQGQPLRAAALEMAHERAGAAASAP